MSGSGARDGFGSPPWDPADPVPHPDLDDTQALPGLGSIPGPTGPGPAPGANGSGRTTTPAIRPAAGGGARFGGAPQRSARADETRVDLTAAVDGPTDRPAPTAPTAPAAARRRQGRQAGQGGKRRRSFWRELPVLVVVALVLALLIKSFVVQAFYIPSASMENTLEIGDRVLINKIVYHTRPIHRGDIVVFDGTGSWDIADAPASTNIFSKAVSELEGIVGISHDSNIYIKRVIGVPGDHVACCNAKGQVTVNGVALTESSYLYPGNQPSAQPFSITVPPGQALGDGRPPGRLLRLPRAHGRSRRRDDPGERGARPRLRDHLAAEPVGLPQHPRDLRAAAAERVQRRGRRVDRGPGRRDGQRHPDPDGRAPPCRSASASSARSRSPCCSAPPAAA